MHDTCTGIILAGGRNTRFSGINKAFIRLGGKRILDRIYDLFYNLFQEIIIVTNDPVQYLEWNADIVTDLFPVRSSLTGIHAGLFYMTTPYAFVAACDTPFMQTQLVKLILEGIEPHIDIIAPETAEGYQPLCSVYSKRCLNPISRQIEKQELKIDRIFKRVRLKKISEKALRQQDSDLISFYNINTPEDLTKAEAMLERTPLTRQIDAAEII